MAQVYRQVSAQASSAAKRVLILGGGFAGLSVAKELCKRLSPELRRDGAVEVVVVNKHNYHLFTPLLYQMSTGLVDISAIAQPIRPMGARMGFAFLEAEVKSINVQARVVYTSERSIPYDYLVIALGTVKDDTKVEGATEYAIPLKTLEDGKRIHNRIVQSFEHAAALDDGPEREQCLTFVVIGGSTGVELAGSIIDYVKDVANDYPRIDTRRDCRVVVVEAGDHLFPGGDSSLSDIVRRSLESRGAEILLGTRVERIDGTKLMLSNGDTIRARSIFDNSGVRPNPVVDTIPEDVAKKHRGKLEVDSYLKVPGFDNVFAIGDNSAVAVGYDEDGKPRYAPPTAESAVEEGKYVGKSLARELNLALTRSPSAEVGDGVAADHPPQFRYREKGTMISIGAHTGVAKFPNFTFTGVMGWLIWRVVHLYLIATVRAKMTVAFDWLLDIFGDVDTSELP